MMINPKVTQNDNDPKEAQNDNDPKEPQNGNFDPKEDFLNKFLDWPHRWKNCNLATGFLTKETFSALYDTTHCILQLKDYCFSELGMKTFFTGNRSSIWEIQKIIRKSVFYFTESVIRE